jgi:hypothetical protein
MMVFFCCLRRSSLAQGSLAAQTPCTRSPLAKGANSYWGEQSPKANCLSAVSSSFV